MNTILTFFYGQSHKGTKAWQYRQYRGHIKIIVHTEFLHLVEQQY